MSDSNEIARLNHEAAALRAQMELSRQEIRTARLELNQKKLESRVLPPMAQMTRIQKRYFLEPWWTVGWVSAWLLCLPAFIAGMFTPWHVEFSMLGLLLLLTGGAFMAAKLVVADWNSRTEGEVQGRNRGY